MCSVRLQSREGSEIEAHRIVLSANELHDKIQQSEQVVSLVHLECLDDCVAKLAEKGDSSRHLQSAHEPGQ